MTEKHLKEKHEKLK